MNVKDTKLQKIVNFIFQIFFQTNLQISSIFDKQWCSLAFVMATLALP